MADLMTEHAVEATGAAWLEREWLLTDGAGGFAFGSLAGVPQRRYHALLNAAMTPPTGRLTAWQGVIDDLQIAGDEELIALWGATFGDDPLPQPLRLGLDGGDAVLRDVAHDPRGGHVTWTFVVGAHTIRRRLTMTGPARVELTYDVSAAERDVTLFVRPLTPMRNAHDLVPPGATPPTFEVDGAALTVRQAIFDTTATLHLTAPDGAAWESMPEWWRTVSYPIDRARGQEDREDLFTPARVALHCPAHATRQWTIHASVDGATRTIVPGPIPRRDAAAERMIERLDAAADQFVVRRGDGWSVIAGYPWFNDWGRDTMIALPGLLIERDRIDIATSILRTFASYQRRGLLPNCFDDHGDGAMYNAADAPLWFIHAAYCVWRRAADAIDETVLDACRDIIAWYRRGTDHGIHLDRDGLISAGDGGKPVTWMDAQRGGVTFTPRDGKAVEINALWYHALWALATMLRDHAEAIHLRRDAERTARTFRRSFWWSERDALHDVLVADARGTWTPDGTLRPNQIFAVGLPHSPLDLRMQQAVVATVRRRLLTPVGLRTLDRAAEGYRGRFEGDLMQLDGAYHNGTVWPWLLGAYGDAMRRLGASSMQVRSIAAALVAELDDGCVGQVAEVYDGDPPHRPGGCPAQAWSVAEVLRLVRGAID